MQRDVPLRERARGHWRGILPHLGIDARLLDGKHHACPICREGKDRFRFDNKKNEGNWICSHCGAGDGFKLVMLATGEDFKQIAPRIEALIGSTPLDAPAREQSPRSQRDAMNRLWASSSAVQAGDPVGLYLTRRLGLSGAASFPRHLHTALHVRYTDEMPSFHPAMLARVTGATGQPENVHRTYLTQDGQKAAVSDPRRMMPGTIPGGSAVRLAPAAAVMGIAEGIETALSASILFGLPVWAALNASLLEKWEPPAIVERVIVFGDNDPNYTGQAAANVLAKRLTSKSRSVEVRIPERADSDWNDHLREQQGLACLQVARGAREQTITRNEAAA